MKHVSVFSKLYSIAWMLLLSSAFNTAAAQSDSIPDYKPVYKQAKNFITYRTKISLVPFGIGMMSAPAHTGNLNVSFPYQRIDASGTKTAHVFNGSTHHMFSEKSPEILFGMDFTRPHFAINFNTGVNTSYKGAFYSTGIALNLYLGHWKGSLLEKTENCTWTIRPSLNVTYFSFRSGNLGTIDNTNATIYALGRPAKPTFYYLKWDSKFPTTGTANAGNLVVSYKQNQLGIMPKIALCTNPYKKTYGIQIFASYFIPLFESSGILLRQYSDDKAHKHLVSGTSANNLTHEDDVTITYNNQSFRSSAFRANYFFVGILFVCTFQS